MTSNRSSQDGGNSRAKGPREYQRYRKGSQRPRHPDKEVDQRVRELDGERDPLSLPEEIVSEASKAGQKVGIPDICLLYTSPSPRDLSTSRMPSSA